MFFSLYNKYKIAIPNDTVVAIPSIERPEKLPIQQIIQIKFNLEISEFYRLFFDLIVTKNNKTDVG